MSTFAELARRTAKFAVDNSPTILTTVGALGTVATAVAAGKASFQAAEIIHLKEMEDATRGIHLDNHNEIMRQRIQLVWKLYIPTVAMGAATLVCVIGANRIGSRRAASLAAIVTLSEKAFEQYKDKVTEKIGERKEQQVRDEVIQDRVNEMYDSNMEIYGAPAGELCIDKFSLHPFRSTAEKIHAAVNDFNYLLVRQEYATLADFYELLNLPCPSYSEQVGWHITRGLLEVRIGGATTPDMKACLTMEFKSDPLPDYLRFR